MASWKSWSSVAGLSVAWAVEAAFSFPGDKAEPRAVIARVGCEGDDDG